MALKVNDEKQLRELAEQIEDSGGDASAIWKELGELGTDPTVQPQIRKGIITTAKETLKSALAAKTEEERATERMQRATTKLQLEKARAELRASKMERQRKELLAKASVERAKTELNRAKAEQLKASDAKWAARYARFGTATGGISKVVKSTFGGAGIGIRTFGDDDSLDNLGYNAFDYDDKPRRATRSVPGLVRKKKKQSTRSKSRSRGRSKSTINLIMR